MNIHERFREDIEARSEALKKLEEGTEDHKRAVDEYTSMYKLALEHEKLDEEVNDRRYRIEKEIELEYAKMKSDKKTKLIGFGVVGGTTVGLTIVENLGLIKPKITEVLRITRF